MKLKFIFADFVAYAIGAVIPLNHSLTISKVNDTGIQQQHRPQQLQEFNTTMLAKDFGTDVQGETDKLIFGVDIMLFVLNGTIRQPPELIWDTKYCVHLIDEPIGFPFKPACWRKDFAYRNYKDQLRWTEEAKLRIDLNYYDDLKDSCDTMFAWSRPACEDMARLYYLTARLDKKGAI